jgi:hypothetical protein
LDSYILFLPLVKVEFVDLGERFCNKPQSKLLNEIQILNLKIIKIDNMTMSEATKEVLFRNSKHKSQLNETNA